MSAEPVACAKCSNLLPGGFYNADDFRPCPHCGTPLLVRVFPALLREPERGRLGEAVLLDDDATCFQHPDRRAAVPCDACGRFLCALCDIEMDERHVCPSCFEKGIDGGKIGRLDNARRRYDYLALTLAVVPLLLFFWVTCVTAPTSLYICIRYWKRPGSLISNSKAYFIVAFISSLIQIAAWIAVIFYIAI